MNSSTSTAPLEDAPFFAAGDVGVALEFYRKNLGFDLGWRWGEPPTHANVCRDEISIGLTVKPSPEAGGKAIGIRVFLDKAQRGAVEDMILRAWKFRASKKEVAAFSTAG